MRAAVDEGTANPRFHSIFLHRLPGLLSKSEQSSSCLSGINKSHFPGLLLWKYMEHENC